MKKVLLLVLMLMLGFLAACGSSQISKEEKNDEQASEEASSNGEEAKKENETQNLTVGDTVNFDGVKVTLNEARIEPGGEFDSPTEEQFVVVNLTAENTTDEEKTVSSIMNIEFKDNEGYSYTQTFLGEGTKGQYDGAIEPGGKLRGEIVFDVPAADSYELHYSNPFKEGKAIWKIDNLSE